MSAHERVAENLNAGLHALFARDPAVYLLGEDVADPYGGAFKISRGLSSRYPERVLNTPISEGAIVGIAGGLALSGCRPIAEMMFGDFVTLGFDQILNFASKSVSMYGRPVALPLVLRCPVGGGRGYGPTHSQSLQKHFIGIPHLPLFELSPFHDSAALLERLVGLDTPCMLFEDKVLYTQPVYRAGRVDELFGFRMLGPRQEFALVAPDDFPARDCLVIAPGGMFGRCLAAARQALLDAEIGVRIAVPSQLYPFPLEPLCEEIAAAERVLVVEEGLAGGTWGCEVAEAIYSRMWGLVRHKIRLVHSQPCVIPAAVHLERQVLVQADDIAAALMKEVCGA